MRADKIRAQVVLNEADYRRVCECAAAHGLSFSSYARILLLHCDFPLPGEKAPPQAVSE